MGNANSSLAPFPHGGGTPPKLIDYVPTIKKLLEEKNDATLPELCQNLKERTGISVSPSTLCRFLQKLNLTIKKTFPAPQVSTERVQNRRFNYWDFVRNVKPEDFIFIDETGINLALVLTYDRSVKGTRTYGERPYQRGQNVSLIGAIC